LTSALLLPTCRCIEFGLRSRKQNGLTSLLYYETGYGLLATEPDRERNRGETNNAVRTNCAHSKMKWVNVFRLSCCRLEFDVLKKRTSCIFRDFVSIRAFTFHWYSQSSMAATWHGKSGGKKAYNWNVRTPPWMWAHKIKVVPVLNEAPRHSMYGEWRYGSTILHLGTREIWVVNFTPRPPYPRGKIPRYPFHRMLGGPQSRSGRHGEEKILYPTGTRTPTPWSSSQ
jgi:hypothetical protein